MKPQQLLEHAHFVRALARSLVADGNDADDVEQQTWLASVQRPPREPSKARSWLAAVAANFARRTRRDRVLRESREASAAAASARDLRLREAAATTVDLVARRETMDELVAAVFALDDLYSTVVVLRFYDELDPAAIATRLAVPVETVRTRLKRALAQLRERLDRRHHGQREEWLAALAPLASLAGRTGVGVAALPPASPASPGSAAAVSTSSAALATGVLLMSAKAKLVVGLVVAAAAVGGAWKWSASWRGRTTAADALHRRMDAAAEERTTVEGASSDRSASSASSSDGVAAERSALPRSEVASGAPTILGRVVDESGQPIARACLVAYLDDQTRAVRIDFDGDARREKDAEPRLARTTSGDDGRFVLAVERERTRFEVAASAEGFFPTALRGVVAGREVELKLARAWALTGRVLDLDGQPIADVAIRVHVPLSRGFFERTTTSSSDGSYRVTGLTPPGVEVIPFGDLLTAEHPDFAPLFVGSPVWKSRRAGSRVESEREFHHDLYLGRGVTLHGRVVDATNDQPIAGATVHLETWFGSHDESRDGEYVHDDLGPPLLGRTVTAADGTFELDHVPADTVDQMRPQFEPTTSRQMGQVGAWAPGHALASSMVRLWTEGSRPYVELASFPAVDVVGRVVDSEGRPLAGRRVHVSDGVPSVGSMRTMADVAPLWCATTGDDGRYALRGVAVRAEETSLTLSVWCGDGDADQDGSHEKKIVARAGANANAPDFVLTHGVLPSVLLHVVDELGQPILGATACPIVANATTRRTGADGVAELRPDGAPRVAEYDALVAAEGFGPSLVHVAPSAARPTVEVALAREHVLRGTLGVKLDEPDLVELDVFDGALPAVPDLAHRYDETWADGTTTRLGRVGQMLLRQGGAFEVRGLPPPPWHVVASRVRFASRCEHVERFGVTERDLPLALELPAASETRKTANLEVDVVDAATKRPVLTAWYVSLQSDEPRQVADATPISPGRFRFERAPLGTWGLVVNAEGYRVKSQRVVLDRVDAEERCTVALERGAALRGRVRARDGTKLRGLQLFLTTAGLQRQSGICNADGSFEIGGLSAGTYHVWFGATNDRSHRTWKAVPDDVVTIGGDESGDEVSLEVVPAVVVNVAVRCNDLPAWSGADERSATKPQVELSRGSSLAVRGADGHEVAKVDRLGQASNTLVVPVGEWTLTLTIPGREPRSQPLALTMDSPDRVEVAFDAQ
jgi:RNA polymerase sigma-70 factor (ECF subfamily)